MIIHFLYILKHYVIEIAPSLVLGLLLSGIIHEFVKQSSVDRYFIKKGILSIFYATGAGIFLPLCCFGSLPVAIGLKKKGVPLGPILAFLVATPATSLTSILVTWRLLGTKFTLYLCLSVILMGLIIGVIGNFLSPKDVGFQDSSTCPMCKGGEDIDYSYNDRGIKKRITRALSFGFIRIPKEIGLELMIGLILAAVVASVVPLGNIIKNHLGGTLGYFFALIFGLLMYICATGSVPLVHAFMSQGLNLGASLVLLLVGPITSYGTILVIRKEFGNKILLVYLFVICLSSLILGYLYSLLYSLFS